MLLIGVIGRKWNVAGLALIPNAFAIIFFLVIIRKDLAKRLISNVSNVLAKPSDLSQLGLKSVECGGFQEGKVSKWVNGGLLASISNF